MSELQEPGMTDQEREELFLATYIQLSRIYDVLLFANKDVPGINDLIESHRAGKLFGPVPSLAPLED